MYGNAPHPQHGKQSMSTGAKLAVGCGGFAGVAFLLLVMLAACGAMLSETGSGSSAAGAAPTAERESSADSTSGGESEPAAEPEPKDEPESEPKDDKPDTPKPKPEPESYSAGTYMVGDDIKPGTYSTDGPSDGSFTGMCYWARLAGTSGELGDIVANQNIQGPGVVTVASSDVALELSGDCEWTLDK